MRRSLLIVLFLAVGLVVSGCGKSSDSGSATTTTAPGSTTTSAPSASEDKAKASAIVLTQADVGAGYKPAPAEGDEEDESTPEADKLFEECSQNNPVLNSESDERSAESEFEKDELTSVSSEAQFWTNEAEFKAAMDVLASDGFTGCLDKAFAKLFSEMGEQGAAVSNIKTTKKSVTAAGVDQASGLTTSMTISAGAVKVELFMEMSFLRKGRAGVMLVTSTGQKKFPAAETDRLTAVLAQRLVANAS